MSSAKNPSGKSEQHLEEQLNENQCAHRKTKDQAQSDKIRQLESDIADLRKRNEELQQANFNLLLVPKYTESMRAEKKNLEEELKSKCEEIEKLNESLMEKSDRIQELENLPLPKNSLRRENLDLKNTIKMNEQLMEEQRKKIEDQQRSNLHLIQTYNDLKEELKMRNEEIEKMSLETVKKEKCWERIVDNLRQENSSLIKSVGILTEDLRNTPKAREQLVEEPSEKIRVFEKKVQDLQEGNLHLILTNSGLTANKAMDTLEEMKKKTEEIEKMSEVISELSDEIECLESYSDLKKYQEEILTDRWFERDNLMSKKVELIRWCCSLSLNFVPFTYLSILTSSFGIQLREKDQEELKRIQEARKKTNDEWLWWMYYYSLFLNVSTVIDVVNRTCSRFDYLRNQDLIQSQALLQREKKEFCQWSEYLKNRMEGKKWIYKEIFTGERYWKKLEELVEKTEKMKIEDEKKLAQEQNNK